VELSKDDDIFAAVAAGQGTLAVPSTLVRCPVIDFSVLRKWSDAGGRGPFFGFSTMSSGRRLLPPPHFS